MRHEKTEDLIRLAHMLASSAEGMTLDEMCDAMAKKRRTIERMRDALRQIFPQLEEELDGHAKRFRIREGLGAFFIAPTVSELQELSNAVKALRDEGHPKRAGTLSRLDKKIRGAMNDAARRRTAADLEALSALELTAVRAGPTPHEDAAMIETIRLARASMKALTFRYGGGTKSGRMRTVVPYGLLYERMNYLVGTEHGLPEPVIWRLDRISDIAVSDVTAHAPADFDLQAYANISFGVFHDGVEDVEFRVLPGRADDARTWRFHASQALRDEPDGSVIVTFRAAGMLELAWHLFTWGDQIEIVRPERLKVTMLEALESCLRAHRSRLQHKQKRVEIC